jgi:hypothetical protein
MESLQAGKSVKPRSLHQLSWKVSTSEAGKPPTVKLQISNSKAGKSPPVKK